MTVKELIGQLQKFDGDVQVFGDFGDGVYGIETVEQDEVYPDTEEDLIPEEGIDAVILGCAYQVVVN
jgi:hypothetical protein